MGKYVGRLLQAAGCRYFWWFVAGLMLALEGGALYFQHVLHYYPCELCIYVRVWLAAIFILSLLALGLKRWFWGQVLVSLVGLGLSIGLALETWGLIQVEYGIGSGGACGFKANFPEWAPLDTWMPWMFEVQDLCQATPEFFWGVSMTHGLIVTSAGLIALFLCAVMGAIFRRGA